MNPEEGLTKLSVPGYRIDSINKMMVTDESGIPTYTFDIKLRIDTSSRLYVDVSGSVIFNDADLSIAHTLEGLQLYVKENGKYMEDPQIKRDDYDDCTYSFKPKELFPAFRNLSSDITPHPYTYTIEAGRYLGDYELQGTFGLDVYYLRHVSVSGTVDWEDDTRPEREPSVKVELLRDGEPTGLTKYTDAQHQYVFDNLPITEGGDREPYQYSIRATVKGGEGAVVYRAVERDLTNGNFTANAIIANPHTVTVTNDGYGTATADPTSGLPETSVKLTATPSTGYEFDHWEVIKGGVTVTNNQFTIGTADVEIQACFREITPVLTGISITTAPDKTEYTEGETFDPTGMVVTATYSDDSTETVTDYTISPDGALTTSDTAVTISYTEDGETKTAEQAITVKPAPVTLTGIGIITPPDKTVYTEGESFDPTGMQVVSIYSDRTNKTVTGYTFSPDGALATSATTVTVSYTEGSETRTATQTITVRESVPRTGDNTHPVLLLMLMIASAGTLLLISCKTRKRNED